MRVIVNIDVPDLAPAIDFYSAALGLKLNRIIEGDVAELAGASSVIYLLQNPGGSHPVSTLPLARDYSRHWTPVHMDFVVDDVTEAANERWTRAQSQRVNVSNGMVQNASPSRIHSVTDFALLSLRGRRTVPVTPDESSILVQWT